MALKKLYCLESGILLDKTDKEFSQYQIKDFYEEYGFWDDDRTLYFNKAQAIKSAKELVSVSENGTYAIVHFDYQSNWHLNNEMIEEIKRYGACDDIWFSPCKASTILFIAKINNKIKVIKGE